MVRHGLWWCVGVMVSGVVGAFSACTIADAGSADATTDTAVVDASDDVSVDVASDSVMSTDSADAAPDTPPAFVPLDIQPSLELWLRSDTIILDDGGFVVRWPDLSGLGDITRDPVAPSGLGPLVDTEGGYGYPALSFQSAQYLQSPPWSDDASVVPPFTIFIVGGQDGSAVDNRYFFDSIDPAQRCSILALGGLRLISSGSLSAPAGSTLGRRAVILTMNGGVTIRNNATTPQVLDGSPTYATFNGVTIGSFAGLGGNYALDGHIAEVAIWSRELSTSELSQLTTYAANRYSLTIGP